jgi:riboflavin biosynthesis pyrimidine reductase
MRVLLGGSGDVTTEQGLHDAYAAPRRDWLRANFVASADGSASLDGRAGGLGSPADQDVLRTLRAQADVVLVGAGTVRAEGYGPLRHSASRGQRRRDAGLADTARLAVVTASMLIDGSERWIAEAAVPPLLLTTKKAARPIKGAEVTVCGDVAVDLSLALTALAERGLRHVLCEGGPTLFGQLAGTGRLDELCLTISPIMAGPGGPRIVDGPPWPQGQRGRLTGLLEDEGLLFARYAFGAD